MLRDAERKAEKESIVKIEAYKKHEKHVYRRIEQERAADSDKQLNHEHHERELKKRIDELQSELLEIEMKLQDALQKARKEFFTKVGEIIKEMGDLNSDYIKFVSTEVALFNEKFKDAALLEFDRFCIHMQEVGEEEIEKEYESNVEYLTLMVIFTQDSELLPAHLDNFKEITEREISAYEQTINSQIARDWNATKSKIESEQHTRNREII